MAAHLKAQFLFLRAFLKLLTLYRITATQTDKLITCTAPLATSSPDISSSSISSVVVKQMNYLELEQQVVLPNIWTDISLLQIQFIGISGRYVTRNYVT